MAKNSQVCIRDDALEALLEVAGEAVFRLDKDGTLSWCNKVASDRMDYPREEMLGKHFRFMVSPESAELAVKRFETVVSGKAPPPPPYELLLRPREGEPIPVQITLAPIVSAGEIRGAIGIARDLTEKKLMESALEESEKEFHALLESAGSAVMLLEEDLTVSRVNLKFCEMTGWARSEVEGKKKWAEFLSAQEDVRRMAQHCAQRGPGAHPSPKTFTIRLADKAGNEKSVLVTIDPSPGSKRCIASMMDVTERTRAQEALNRMHKEFDESLKAQIDFLSARLSELEAGERPAQGGTRNERAPPSPAGKESGMQAACPGAEPLQSEVDGLGQRIARLEKKRGG
jgi:PAS domain S-box-containing protein